MEIEEVAQDTYRMETPVAGSGLILSVYLIRENSGILIEPGPTTAVPQIQEGMKQLGMDGLSMIVPTHIHMDHGGGVGRLSELFPQAEVIAHPLSARHIINPGRLIESTRLSYGDYFEDIYGPILPVQESRVRVSDDGECISFRNRDLQIIHAPGHAPHHVVVYDKKTGALFCGEALGMETDDPLPAAAAPSFDVNDYLQTINKLKSMNPQLLCYSHGGIRQEVDTRISLVMRNTQLYGDMVLECLKSNLSTQEIGNAISNKAGVNYPPHWEDDMIRVADRYCRGI